MTEEENIMKGCGESVYSDNTPYAPSYHVCRGGMLCSLCKKKLKELKKEQVKNEKH